CSQVRLLRYALVIRSQGAGFYKIQHTPCELSYTSPPLLKHPLKNLGYNFFMMININVLMLLDREYLNLNSIAR
ncbi:hypothetical protein LC605_32610, partial [Nostoc sp. CHAB 5836]|uniref:hypothetical protein n=1 Tax=Nostoc sp. CHAB 5836 TaxID=2780404 RepID=UPI001E4958D2